MAMVQRKFYLPVEMYRQLQVQASHEKKTITAILREAVALGMEKKRKNRPNAAAGLLKLAEQAEREGWGEGITDAAENHDKYAAEAALADLKRIHEDYH